MPRKYARRPRKMRKSKKSPLSKAKKSANLDVYKFQIKQSFTLTPTQGATVSNYFNVMVSPAPGDGIGAQSGALKVSTEFALYRQMFDQFRVLGVTMKVMPKVTVSETAAMTLASGTDMTVGKCVYYTIIDRDGTVPSSISAINKYSSRKVHKTTSSVTRSYNVNYEGKNTWFDCQNVNDMPDIQKSLGLWGGISVYAESLPEQTGTLFNLPWADVEIVYRLAFRGKSLVGVAVGDDGTVTLKQPDLTILDPVLTFLSSDSNDHLGAVDNSGNIIT